MIDRDTAEGERWVGQSVGSGRYVIVGVLGEGAQGATLDAVDKKEGRPVAIKRFSVRGARSWKDVELAEREADVLGALSHRLLPAALDRFEEDGALYLVMEKIDGPTLASIGVVDEAEVIRFLHDASEVLDYLHGRVPVVIHRDIKPRNVIRRPPPSDGAAPSYVLVDFGSVRASLEPAGGSTVVGTFGYMAPEQFQGRAMPASDVYAVGATALRMLTGIEPEKLPHKGLALDTKSALPNRDPALVAALQAMVEPDPDVRPSRIAPLLRELGRRPPGREQKASRVRPRVSPQPPRAVGIAPIRSATLDQDAAIPLPAIARVIMLFALAVASAAIWVSTQIVVPVVLGILSLVFGHTLRRTAVKVRIAGERARRSLAELPIVQGGAARVGRRGKRRQRREHGPEDPGAPTRRRVRGGTIGDARPAGSRIDVQRDDAEHFAEGIDEAVEEVQSALEEAVNEVTHEIEDRRRR